MTVYTDLNKQVCEPWLPSTEGAENTSTTIAIPAFYGVVLDTAATDGKTKVKLPVNSDTLPVCGISRGIIDASGIGEIARRNGDVVRCIAGGAISPEQECHISITTATLGKALPFTKGTSSAAMVVGRNVSNFTTADGNTFLLQLGIRSAVST